MENERIYLRLFLVLPALLVLYFVFRIFQPFLQAICLAIILASLFYPIYRILLRWMKDRSNVAALVTCLLIFGVIVLPFLGLVAALAKEVSDLYLRIQQGIQSGELEELTRLEQYPYIGYVVETVDYWLGGYVDFAEIDLIGSIAASLQELSVFLLRHSTALLGSFAQLLSKFFIMLVTMFFLFRDGSRLVEEIRGLTPISGRYERLLAKKFREVTRATVIGSLVTALAQGVAGGIVFFFLGVDNLVFWSALMALFSLVPVVGSSLIWAPWAVYFLATGALGKVIVLLLAAVFFIGMIDNVLRPLFIEGQSGMHTLLVFFSIMGGIAYFGMVGMIFGPILVSLCLTFIELYRLEFRQELVKPSS